MATAVSPALERAARALAGRHYAYRFGQPEEHPMVAQNIAAGWSDFLGDADAALSAIAVPADDILAAIKPAKERDEFAHQWKSVFAAILG